MTNPSVFPRRHFTPPPISVSDHKHHYLLRKGKLYFQPIDPKHKDLWKRLAFANEDLPDRSRWEHS